MATKFIEEVKPYKCYGKHSRPNGKSTYKVECPFCGYEFEMQVWSTLTTGKKCLCGAVLRGNTARRKIKATEQAQLCK